MFDSQAARLETCPPNMRGRARLNTNEAAVEYVRTGKKPSGYTDTGVNLITKSPVDGVASTIGDMRYAAEASSISPLWGMQFDAHEVDGPSRWRPPNSSRTRIVTNIWRSLIGHDPGYQPVHDVLNARPG